MTLGSLLFNLIPWFFGAVSLALFFDFVLKMRTKAKAKTSKALVVSTPKRPAERVYSADEVRVMAEEYHRRMVKGKPARTVKFEDGWYDPESGEVFSN